MTEWFERGKGDTGPLTKTTEDGGVLVVSLYGDVPDWVRTPPTLGERKIKVLGAHMAICPMCREHDVRHLDLDDKYQVAQCHKNCGYVWYATR